MQANHPDLMDSFSDSLLLLASFGDVINRNMYEEIYKEALMLLMIEFKRLIDERDRDLAMAKYHSNKARLLVIQAELLKLPVDKEKDRKKLIKGLHKDLTEMLGMLEYVKEKYID